MLISGDQGEILGVVSESEKSFDEDLQHASLEAEKLAVDIEEFQVSFWSLYLFCCYLFFVVCVFLFQSIFAFTSKMFIFRKTNFDGYYEAESCFQF